MLGRGNINSRLDFAMMNVAESGIKKVEKDADSNGLSDVLDSSASTSLYPQQSSAESKLSYDLKPSPPLDINRSRTMHKLRRKGYNQG